MLNHLRQNYRPFVANFTTKRCLLHMGRTKPQDPESIKQMDTFEFVDETITKSKQQRLTAYCWGYSATGALGDEHYLSKYEKGGHIQQPKRMYRSRPKPMQMINDPKRFRLYDIAAGFGYTVIAGTLHGTDHVLFGCGLNTDSQVGYQESNNEAMICIGNIVPIDLPLDRNSNKKSSPNEYVRKVACGRAHTICLTNNHNVFSMGNNSFGQCGRPVVEDEKYFASKRIHRITIPNDDVISQVECGLDHTLLLTSNGSVYSCGWGCDGQLGNGRLDSQCHTISKVIGDIENEHIVQISCSGDTVLVVNDKGQVFGWGNNEYGQLLNCQTETQIPVAKHLRLVEEICGKVTQVAAAGSMCSVLNQHGQVFVWGYGCLGLGPNQHQQSTPAEINSKLFNNGKGNGQVKRIYAGLHRFGAINHRGQVFVWGANVRPENEKRGKKPEEIMFPRMQEMPIYCTKLSFGIDHSLAMGHKF